MVTVTFSATDHNAGSSWERVRIGQVWERRNGSRFIIDRITPGYVHYWLATGSHPQFRSIRIDLLIKHYKLIGKGQHGH